MSYMNDDTDPFGIPYPKSEKVKKEVTYSFEDLQNLMQEKKELERELHHTKNKIEDAKERLNDKLSKYFYSYKTLIEYDDFYCYWKIITTDFELSTLEKIKKDFRFKDITVKLDKYKINGKYQDRLIIELEV